MDSLQFAENYATTISKERKTILQQETLLKNKNEVLVKKKGLFNIGMQSFDSTKVAKLCGLKLQAEIQEKVPEISFWLYWDNGLAVVNHQKCCFAGRTRKTWIEMFKNACLKFAIEMRLHKVNNLDVTIDLKDDTYRPYEKPNDKII